MWRKRYSKGSRRNSFTEFALRFRPDSVDLIEHPGYPSADDVQYRDRILKDLVSEKGLERNEHPIEALKRVVKIERGRSSEVEER